jgi:MFS family permease
MSALPHNTSVLRAPGVLRLFIASLVARFPLAALGVLFVLQARDLGHSYAEGGAIAAASAVGMAFGAPVLGRLIDTRGQTLVLISSALLCCGALLATALVDPDVPVGAVAGLAALAGFAQPPVSAAARAVWGRMLDSARLHEVLALEAGLQELAFMLGPIVLVSVVGAGKPSHGLIGAAVIFLLSTVAYALGPEPRAMRGTPRRGSQRRAMAIPGVQTLFLLAITLGVMFGSLEVGIAAFAEHSGHRGATGLLLAAWGIGSLAAGLWAARRGPAKDPVAELLWLHVALTVCNGVLIAAPGLVGLGVLLVIAGVAIAPLFAVIYRILSEVADEESVTEAYAWELTGITAGVAVGSALAGVLASGPGARAAFVAAAVATAVGALVGRARAGTLTPEPARSA